MAASENSFVNQTPSYVAPNRGLRRAISERWNDIYDNWPPEHRLDCRSGGFRASGFLERSRKSVMGEFDRQSHDSARHCLRAQDYAMSLYRGRLLLFNT